MMMSDRFDIESRWPDVFEGLDDQQRRNVVEALAASWHEGGGPNREDVGRLTAKVRGDIHSRGVRCADGFGCAICTPSVMQEV